MKCLDHQGCAKNRIPSVALLLVLGLAPQGLAQATAQTDTGNLLSAWPFTFVPNQGQWDKEVFFQARRGSTYALFDSTGWVLGQVQGVETKEESISPAEAGIGLAAKRPSGFHATTVRMTFEGASNRIPVGEEKLPGYYNYYLGNAPARWRQRVPAFGSIRYTSLYSGIDVVVRDFDGVLEYDVVVQPGASMASVVIRCEGVENLAVGPDGSLLMSAGGITMRQTPPVAWQPDKDGARRAVTASFRLLDPHRYTFEASNRDETLPLVVDPGLVWSTFLGGSLQDWTGHASTSGNLVTVVSQTQSQNFPRTTGAFAGGFDQAITRFDLNRTGAAQLGWSTIFGGNSNEREFEGVTETATGDLVVSGMTYSPNFPTLNLYDPSHNGNFDSYVASFSAQGIMTYSTFLKGSGEDLLMKRAHVEPNGVIPVAGSTNSPNFPATPNAFQGSLSGGNDAFVARLDPSLSGTNQLLWSTFIGGVSFDGARPVVVDASGIVTVGGVTFSANFTCAPPCYPFQGGSGGYGDGFVARLNPSATGASQLLWSTFIGGSGPCPGTGGASGDGITALGLRPDGRIVIAGWTDSCAFPFPLVGFDITYDGGGTLNGGGDAFVSILDPLQPPNQSVLYFTFLGGPGKTGEAVQDLRVDSAGRPTVAGHTDSSSFPVTVGCYQSTLGTAQIMAFVTRLDATAGNLLYSTYLGGSSGLAGGWACPLDDRGGAVVAGFTTTALSMTECVSSNPWFLSTIPRWRRVRRLRGQARHAPDGRADLWYGDPHLQWSSDHGRQPDASGGSDSLWFDLHWSTSECGRPLALSVAPDTTGMSLAGITIWLDLTQPWSWMPVSSSGLGHAEVPISIPPGTAGAQVFGQFAWANTGACGGAGTLSATHALSLTVQ